MRYKRLVRVAAGAVVVVATSVLGTTSGSASADTIFDASLTVQNVTYDGSGECVEAKGTLSVSGIQPWEEWYIGDASIVGPTDWPTPDIDQYSATGPATATVNVAFLCPSDDTAGTYTITAKIYWGDGGYSTLSATFTVSGGSTGPGPVGSASGTVGSDDGVLYHACTHHPFAVDVETPSDDWDINIEVLAPDGSNFDSEYTYSDADASDDYFLFCGDEMPGTYTIKSTAEWTDDDYNDHSFSIPDSTFKMSLAATQTTLKVTPKNPKMNKTFVTFKFTSKDQRPNGFYPTDFASVALQVWVGGKWKTESWSMLTTNSTGTATLRTKLAGKTWKVRAITNTEGYASSVSKAVKVVQH